MVGEGGWGRVIGPLLWLWLAFGMIGTPLLPVTMLLVSVAVFIGGTNGALRVVLSVTGRLARGGPPETSVVPETLTVPET